MSLVIQGSAPTTSVVVMLNEALKISCQLTCEGSGSVSATAVIEGSHDGQGWINISTLNASGSNYATDGGTFETYYPQVRARITAVTGTAKVYWSI